MRKFLFWLSIILYLLSIVNPFPFLQFTLSLVSLCVVVVTFTKVSRAIQIMSSFFLISGILMLATNGATTKDYVLSFGPMMNLLALFAVVPILAVPIQIGNYVQSIEELIFRRIHNSKQLYFLTSGISYFFSSFMNLASLPMTYYTVRSSVTTYQVQHEVRFMSRAITHGFAMPLLWTPVTPIVGIVVDMTGVSWVAMLKYLIPLSVAGLLLDWFIASMIFRKRYRNLLKGENEVATGLLEKAGQAGSRKFFQILIAIALFNGLVILADFQSSFDFLYIVSLLVIPFAFCWSAFLGKRKSFIKELKEHFSSHILKLSGQFVIFLSAGFFISSMKFSHVDHFFNQGLLMVKEEVGSLLFLILIPLVPLVLAFTGLHPAVGLALMAEALDPSSLHISTSLLTLAMLGGAVGAFLMGPFNATIGMMASITDESPYRISNWNTGFTFSYLILLMILLLFLQMI